MAKIIVLRGPSGAGKSTVARALHNRLNKSVLIEQDYYKVVMVRPQEESVELRQEMQLQDIFLAVKHGYNVILDGIYSKHSKAEFFQTIFAKHPSENYLFYFDVPFDETLRRHASRPDKEDLFGEAEMKQWYGVASPLGLPNECIIEAGMSADKAVEYICRTAGIPT